MSFEVGKWYECVNDEDSKPSIKIGDRVKILYQHYPQFPWVKVLGEDSECYNINSDWLNPEPWIMVDGELVRESKAKTLLPGEEGKGVAKLTVIERLERLERELGL